MVLTSQSRFTKYNFFSLCLLSTAIVPIQSDCDCTLLNKNVSFRLSGSPFYINGDWDDKGVRTEVEESEGRYWKLQPSSAIGLYNIVNVVNGLALDRGPVINETAQYYKAAVSEITDSDTQQWYINSDGTISNKGVTNHNLDVARPENIGSDIVLWPKERQLAMYIMEY